MILQTVFFLSLGIGMLVMGCWLSVVGSIVQSNQQPTIYTPQPTTKDQQPTTDNPLLCIVFNGC